MLLAQRLDRRGEHGARIGDVEAARLAAGRAGEVGEQLLVDVGGDHARAFAHVGFGDGAADALAGGGDEGGLAGEAVGHGVRSLEHRWDDRGARRRPRPTVKNSFARWPSVNTGLSRAAPREARSAPGAEARTFAGRDFARAAGRGDTCGGQAVLVAFAERPEPERAWISPSTHRPLRRLPCAAPTVGAGRRWLGAVIAVAGAGRARRARVVADPPAGRAAGRSVEPRRRPRVRRAPRARAGPAAPAAGGAGGPGGGPAAAGRPRRAGRRARSASRRRPGPTCPWCSTRSARSRRSVTVTVRPQVSGVITQVLFTEGQMVKKGQLLATIDPRPFEIALQQAHRRAPARRGAARERQGPARPLPDAARPGLDRAAGRRHAGRARQAARGHDRDRPAPARTRRASTSATAASSRRSPAASACARSTPATTSARAMPTASR